ncbi:hypothetical protein [Nonomuraea sp. NPDC049480]|uniref:hypothetical protein n=1 Tax=Nonomuraea sp. NPDC049480 TaxID=3364353 RepID=UPI003790C2C6
MATSGLIPGERVVRGSLTGSAIENEDDLRVALDRDTRSHNEMFPLSRAPTAYQHMLSGDAGLPRRPRPDEMRQSCPISR